MNSHLFCVACNKELDLSLDSFASQEDYNSFLKEAGIHSVIGQLSLSLVTIFVADGNYGSSIVDCREKNDPQFVILIHDSCLKNWIKKNYVLQEVP